MAIQIEISDLPGDLSRCMDRVEAGENVVVCRDLKPIAEIRPIASARPIGLAKGKVQFLPGFEDPLPENVLAEFEVLAK